MNLSAVIGLVVAVLPCAALASVNLTEVANSVPAEERFLIFDILGKVNSKSVVEAFKNLDVVYKFKVYGGRRHIVVARNSQDDLDTLYDLDIPDADDIKVYPAEHYGSYAKYFYDKEVEDEQMVHLPNANLLLVEFTILADGMSKQQYKDAFKKIVKEYMELANTTPVRAFHLTARYPNKEFVFWSMPDYDVDRLYLEGSDAYEGPGMMITVPTPIFNIRD